MDFEINQSDGHLGKLPADWMVMSLGQLSKSITDGTHFTPIYTKAGIPFYSVENVSANEFEDTKFISESDHLKLIKRCQPQKGDILMTRIGSLGRTKLISWDCNASIYVSLALIKPNLTVSTDYLYAYSQSNFFYKSVINRSLVNAIPQKINMQDIAAIPIPFPPQKVEQEAIAAALRDAEEAVGLLDTFIAKKRDVKQAVIQQLLTGRTRLPGFNSDWKEVFLGDIARVKTGSRNNQDKVAEGLYPFYVRSAHVESIDSYSYDTEAILIPGEGGIGEIFHYTNAPHEVHQRVYRVSDFTPDTYPKFVFFYLRSFFGAHAMRNTVKATVDSLRLPTFLEFELLLPPLMEQKAIAETLSAIDDELQALTEQVSKLRMVKEGMMQDLLTGKVRLV